MLQRMLQHRAMQSLLHLLLHMQTHAHGTCTARGCMPQIMALLELVKSIRGGFRARSCWGSHIATYREGERGRRRREGEGGGGRGGGGRGEGGRGRRGRREEEGE